MAGGRWDGGGAHHCLLYWLLSLGVQSRVQHNSRCFSGRWLLCFRLSSWSLFRFSLWLFVLKVREKRFNIWIHSITKHQTIKILLIILQASSFIKIVLEKSFIHLASWAFTELESLEMDSIIFSFTILKDCHFPWNQAKTYHFGYSYSLSATFWLFASLWHL